MEKKKIGRPPIKDRKDIMVVVQTTVKQKYFAKAKIVIDKASEPFK